MIKDRCNTSRMILKFILLNTLNIKTMNSFTKKYEKYIVQKYKTNILKKCLRMRKTFFFSEKYLKQLRKTSLLRTAHITILNIVRLLDLYYHMLL